MMLAVTVPPLVSALAVLLIAAAAISYLCTRIGLVPIVGFVVAGALVGPHALSLVSDPALIEQTAEIGVIFLLFGIGLELSVERLRSLGSLLFGGGAIQVVLTAGLVATGCVAFGVDARNAIFTGCLVSLSSTAIVLKLLSGRRETTSPVGEVAVAFLIFQDLAVVVMVLLVPMLAGGGDSGLGAILAALAKSAVVLAFVLIGTRWIIPRALDKVAENSSDEVFLLSVAAFALIVAYLSSLMGLTDSLGAFIAGLVVSSSRHRERALRYVTPFQMLFSAVFFASIGMLLDIRFVLDRWMLVAGLALATVAAKTFGASVAAKLFRRPWPVVATSALLLAQVGEFSFVLEQSGRAAGLSPAGVGENGSQAFIATAVLLFVLTPLLDSAGRRLGGRLADRTRLPGEPDVLSLPPVVLFGAGSRAERLVGDAIERASVDNPLQRASIEELRSDASSPLRGAALAVAMDLVPADLDALIDASSGAEPPVPVLAWVADEHVADETVERGVAVIDAHGAAELTVARAVLEALGVEADRRITALTEAVESLPPSYRRPLA